MFYHGKEQLPCCTGSGFLASKSEEKEEGLEKGHLHPLESLLLMRIVPQLTMFQISSKSVTLVSSEWQAQVLQLRPPKVFQPQAV